MTAMESIVKQYEDIPVCSVSEYIECISKLKLQHNAQGTSGHFFFRGQKNKAWDVRPSAFRNNVLSFESELIADAYLRAPMEFVNLSAFEKLTKLQHYGLPTRLLDVTLNPLVALYFACEPYCRSHDLLSITSCDGRVRFLNSIEDPEIDWKTVITEESDGCVFYKEAYEFKFNSVEVDLICQLAELDLSSWIEISQLPPIVKSLNFESILSNKHKEEQHYNTIAKIFNSNYFVTSTFNNPRLIRQSGAFLLPACFCIQRDKHEYKKSLVIKQVASLNSEFELSRFIIPANCKQEILKELDMYNINRGTLFPELEHQMTYIRERRSINEVKDVGNFVVNSLIEENEFNKTEEHAQPLPKQVSVDVTLDDSLSKIIKDVDLQKQICTLIQKQQQFVDWFKKDAILSELRVNIRKILLKNGYDLGKAYICTDQIVQALINKTTSN